jgi:DNA repair photolyase
VLEAAALAGAENAGNVLLRLPLEIKELFTEWLEHNTPDTASHVLSLIRQMRGGALYDAEFGTRMRGNGPLADPLRQRFKAACRLLGLDQRRTELDTSQFCPPPATSDQLSFL